MRNSNSNSEFGFTEPEFAALLDRAAYAPVGVR